MLFDVSYPENYDVVELREKIPLMLNTDYSSVFLRSLFPQASSKIFEGDWSGRARAIWKKSLSTSVTLLASPHSANTAPLWRW